MKTILILLPALCWPALFFAQSSGTAAQFLHEGEQLFVRHADSMALDRAQDAIALIRPNTDYILEGRAYLLAGHAQYKLGYPEDAVPALQKALGLFKQGKNDSLALSTLIVLSATMGDREEPQLDASLHYLTEARDMALKRRDTIQLAKIYINIANVWDEWEEYDTALAYNDSCEMLLRKKPYPYGTGHNCYCRGNTLLKRYIEKGEEADLLKSRLNLLQAIDIFHDLGEQALEAHARNAAGSAALYREEFPNAKIELEKSLELCKALGDSAGMLNAYYNLATLAETEGKSGEAIRALKNLSALMERSSSRHDRIFVKEQFSNSELRISKTIIENKIKILEEKMKNNKNRQTLLVLSSVFTTLFVAGFFYFRQRIRAQRKLMAEQLANLLKEKEIEFVRARLEGEEVGRQKIARKIHDGVEGLLVSAKWNLESALDELPGREKKVLTRLQENIRLQDESYRELRKVVYDLERDRVPWWEDLRKFCEQLSGSKKTDIRFYTYNLDENAGGEVGEEARLITRELITNALKHANASVIHVQINRIDHLLSIVVEDNGKGFDPDTVSKGVGLKSIRERAEELSGSISFDTGMGRGTSVFVDIPLKSVSITENNPQLYASE